MREIISVPGRALLSTVVECEKLSSAWYATSTPGRFSNSDFSQDKNNGKLKITENLNKIINFPGYQWISLLSLLKKKKKISNLDNYLAFGSDSDQLSAVQLWIALSYAGHNTFVNQEFQYI